MDKEKLIQALMWISAFGLSIFLSAISIYAGYNNVRKAGDYPILIIGLISKPSLLTMTSSPTCKAPKLSSINIHFARLGEE